MTVQPCLIESIVYQSVISCAVETASVYHSAGRGKSFSWAKVLSLAGDTKACHFDPEDFALSIVQRPILYSFYTRNIY